MAACHEARCFESKAVPCDSCPPSLPVLFSAEFSWALCAAPGSSALPVCTMHGKIAEEMREILELATVKSVFL